MKLKKILRAYFLIINLIVATIAFSFLIGCTNLVDAAAVNPNSNAIQASGSPCAGGVCPANGGSSSSSSSSTPNPIKFPTADDMSTAPTADPRGNNPLNPNLGGNPISSTPNPNGGSGGSNNPTAQQDYANNNPSEVGLGGSSGSGPSIGPNTGVQPVNPGTGTGGTGADSGQTFADKARGGTTPPGGTTGGQIATGLDSIDPIQAMTAIAGGAGIGTMIGNFAGGKNGAMWGAISGAAGVGAYYLAKAAGLSPWASAGIGLGVGILIFLLTYKKETTEIVEFHCLPWQAPVGGADCEKCNEYNSCDTYACKSLGQACDIVNKGTKSQKCVWKNPQDVNSPTIEISNVTKGHKSVPDTTIRPPATGVVISQTNGACIKAFTPLSFTIKTNEPSQCKIDYKLTTDSKTAFDSMTYYAGGDPIFDYNHTETLSLPGPSNLGNQSSPEIKNDGTYTLYIRCQDANGNFNVDPFSVRFCVDKAPDTTPPIVVNVSIPSGSPVQFNLSSINVEVYVNEPSDCKWSHEDRSYDNMENNMQCDNDVWQMNNFETYTCRANLTGLLSRTTNNFYFKCKDNPTLEESQRNVDRQSFLYTLTGTQPLNILSISPYNETISNSTDYMNVNLEVQTDNGYNNGEALCYYSIVGKDSGYIQFSDNNGNIHTQRQDLMAGNYIYYIKCVDLGGNAVYNYTQFKVETDTSAPLVIRAYKESGQLKIITNEKSECSYSISNCNFDIDVGIPMTTGDYLSHNIEWKNNENYNIRCKDIYNNQPNPNTCSIVLKPSEFGTKSEVIVL